VTFNAGTLVATIRLDGKSKFDSDLDSSGQKFTSTSTLAQRAGKAIGSAFNGAAIATGVASAAATAYVTSLFRTGVAYNTLQQQSRAALTTILGGTQAANAQMDQLDAFAKNSPFAKSVFITAQQQLLGFGLQAQKVIPTLQAVQDAVAAVGGSNDQISQITYALAQIQGQGKLTGDTLTQLGQYGIDAASIIGSKMGKTSQQIRDMASSPGGIPAADVWDPLINGLEDKFAGAAANVKTTWSGTTDRIKAASRDIGATLAAPFVDPHGGGQAITWGNQVADVMRAVQADIGPVVSVIIGRAQPAFDAISAALDRAKLAAGTFDAGKLTDLLDKASTYAPAVAGIGGAVAALNLNLLKSIPVLGSFLPAVNPVVAAIAGIALSSPEVRKALGDILKAFQPLLPVGVQLAKILANDLSAILPTVATLLEAVATAATPLVEIIAKIPAPLILAVAGFAAFKSAQQTMSLGLIDAGIKVEGFLSHLGPVGGKLGGVVNAFQGAAGFLSGPWGLAVGGAAALLGGMLLDNMAKAQQKVDDYTGSLEKNTGALTDNTRADALKGLQESGAIKQGAQLGLSVKTLTDAALGNKDAIKTVNDAYQDFLKTSEQGTGAANQQGTVWSQLLSKIGAESDALGQAKENNREWLQASDATKTQLSDLASKTQTFSDAVAANGAVIDANGNIIDKNSAAYQAEKSALDDVVTAGQAAITTAQNQKDGYYAVQAATDASVQSVYASVAAMGYSGQAAIDYTAKLLGIPASKVTQILVDKAAADNAVNAWNAHVDSIQKAITVHLGVAVDHGHVNIATTGGGNLAWANGGIVDYYANGGLRRPERHVAQIAPAGSWRVWAEEETGGEAYIPLAPSKRKQSISIWEQTGQRLGLYADGAIAVGSARDTFVSRAMAPVASVSSSRGAVTGNTFTPREIPPIQVYANDPEAAGLSVFRRISMLGA
jgi:tape measure domain-containing protein